MHIFTYTSNIKQDRPVINRSPNFAYYYDLFTTGPHFHLSIFITILHLKLPVLRRQAPVILPLIISDQRLWVPGPAFLFPVYKFQEHPLTSNLVPPFQDASSSTRAHRQVNALEEAGLHSHLLPCLDYIIHLGASCTFS